MAQFEGAPQLRPRTFVPGGASISKQMSVDFESDRVPEIVQMYSVPDASQSACQTAGINVLKFNPGSGWMLAYRETDQIELEPGADKITTEVVTGRSAKQGVVIIFYHSGAGTVTVWHVLASVDGKITKLDRAEIAGQSDRRAGVCG